MSTSALEDSLEPYGAEQLERAAECAEIMLGVPVDHVTRISGGGNNGMFRVLSSKGQHALKVYRNDPFDSRDRQGTEAAANNFMRKNGIEQIPKTVATDPRTRSAIFEWLDGARVTSPTLGDIDVAWQFASRLQEANAFPGADKIQLASDACLSFKDIVDQTSQRLERFLNHDGLQDNCRGFLNREFKPAFEEISEREKSFLEKSGFAFSSQLPPDRRTLSPSDFGFHNAMRRPSGELVFIDFEYFGWDDPAKLICDFILHPGMDLPEELQERFVAQADSIYSGNPQLMERMHHAMPLFALRWCMIVLNVFLRGDEEIELADLAGAPADVVKRQRILKARDLLSYAVTFARMI